MIGTPLIASLTISVALASVVLSARQQHPSAAADPYLQTVWTTEEGLPQNSVTGIVQTRDGYLWLSTFGGTARFDGVRFTIFNTANTPGLKSNRITALLEDRRGTLWLGTETGELMSLEKGVGATYSLEGPAQGAIVNVLRESRAGGLWVGTSEGLVRFQDGKFTYTTADALPDRNIWSVQEDQNGRIWVTSGGRLVQFDGSQFESHALPDGADMAHCIPRRQGGFWVSASSGLVLFLDGKFISYPHSSRTKWALGSLMQDREGTVWVSTAVPLTLQRFQDGRFSAYTIKSGRHLIRAMYEDREGNLWLGSDGGGLVRLKKRAVTTYTTDEGLPSDVVWAVTDDGAGGAWISTSSGLAHRQEGKFVVYTADDGLLSSYVTALLRDRAGSLWIGSDVGLTRFKDGRFVNFTPAEGLSAPAVRSLAEDTEGNLWIGTLNGLNQFREGRVTIYKRTDGLVHNDVRAIATGRDGALWLGTVGGLSRFKDGSFTNYTTKDGLSNDYVRAIVSEPDGSLWLGTYGGGLNRFKDGRFTPVTTRDGLFDDFVSRILDDDHGNFWLLGNRGVFQISKAELNDFVEGRARGISSISYGIADGMKSSEGNGGAQPAGWRTADGKEPVRNFVCGA